VQCAQVAFTSVTPALSMATSVPVPMAMPTSACASAGASLMPSPPWRPCALGPAGALHDRPCPAADFGKRLVDAELPGNGFRGAARIAGEHHDTDTRALERRDRLWRAVLDWIGDGRDSRATSSMAKNTTVLASARQASARSSSARCQRCAGQESPAPTSTRLPSTSPARPVH